jgi:hypothetical protein
LPDYPIPRLQTRYSGPRLFIAPSTDIDVQVGWTCLPISRSKEGRCAAGLVCLAIGRSDSITILGHLLTTYLPYFICSISLLVIVRDRYERKLLSFSSAYLAWKVVSARTFFLLLRGFLLGWASRSVRIVTRNLTSPEDDGHLCNFEYGVYSICLWIVTARG